MNAARCMRALGAATILLLAAAISSVHAALAWTLRSAAGTRIVVEFSAGNTAGMPATFAFASSPQVRPAVTIAQTAPAPGTIPIARTYAGWYGRQYLQWIVFSPADESRGTVAVDFPQPVIDPASPIRIAGGVLHASIRTALLKAAAADTVPAPPYISGLRIDVDRDGIYRLSGSLLRQKGVPVASVPSRRFRLFEQGREIPIYITNPHHANIQDADVLLFYARELRGAKSYWSQFSNTNVYWLCWNTGVNGLRIAEASGRIRIDETQYRPGGDSVDLDAKEFRDTLHLEEDNDIRWLGSVADPQEMTSSSDEGVFVDNWYWTVTGENEITDVHVTLPGASGSGLARLRCAFMGLTTSPGQGNDHMISLLVNANSPNDRTQTAQWDGQAVFVFETETFHTRELKAGDNVITFRTNPQGFQDRAALNWIEVEYPRAFVAQNDVLSFRNNPADAGALKQFKLRGFSSSDLELWDITNGRFLTGFSVVQERSAQGKRTCTLVFQDSLSGVTTFVAQTVAQRKDPPGISLDTVAGAFDFPAGVDYIMITARSLRTALKPLADHYTRAGMTVALLAIEDIYNRFSYGIRDPESIRTMIRHLIASAGGRMPRYLLLGGDTSHDLDKNISRSGRNIAPTHLSRVPGWGPCSDDGYFACVVGDDNIPDCLTGRFPAENVAQMQAMVAKTLRALDGLEKGPWRENLLLAGGFEHDFSLFNDGAAHDIVGERMNVLRMDADPASPWYISEATAAATLAGFINAGAYAVNFNGHGGGNVWSDSKFFGVNDITRLHNGSWQPSGRLPIVFSFTCLTGFFESAFYTSLGEEMVRAPVSGACGFYGASAYTSKQGNLIMNRRLLDIAVHDSLESVGELIWLSEMYLLAIDDRRWLPLVRQYNYLGDPAMPWRLPPDTLRLTLAKSALDAGDSLAITGACDPVRTGQARIRVKADGRAWTDRSAPVSSGACALTVPVKDSAIAAAGVVRAYAWNDSAEVRGWTTFTKSAVLVSDISISPSPPACGDSVVVRCRITFPVNAPAAAVRCMVALDQPWASNPDFSRMPDVAMVRSAGDTTFWEAAQKIPVPYFGTVDAALLLKFRIPDAYGESRIFSFALVPMPDLRLTNDSVSMQWADDSMRVCFSVINGGTGSAPPFIAQVLWGDGSDTLTEACRAASADSLAPGASLRLCCALPDTQGVLPFVLRLNPGKAFPKLLDDNNTSRGVLSVRYADLSGPEDTLYSAGQGAAIAPQKTWSRSRRAFLFDRRISETRPLTTDSRFLSIVGDSVRQFSAGLRPLLTTGDSLCWIFRPDTSAGGSWLFRKAAAAGAGKPAVMQWDDAIASWRYAPSAYDSAARCLTAIDQAAWFSAAWLTDMTAPAIQLTVAGRRVVFLDYAAKGRSFDVFVNDPSGVYAPAAKALLNRAPMGNAFSAAPSGAAPVSLRATLYPAKENAVDSLTITAQDLAGNDTGVTFAYMSGEKLSIRFLACHPNPFTARQNDAGRTIQTVRFAFLLTDVADKAVLTIYTITGKKIKSWTLPEIIGYQEVEWDGLTEGGNRIANGTYYLKLTAENENGSVKKIIKIAKLEGY